MTQTKKKQSTVPPSRQKRRVAEVVPVDPPHGRIIRQYRVAAGMSLSELAEKLRVTAVQLGAIERGELYLPRDHRWALTYALPGIPLRRGVLLGDRQVRALLMGVTKQMRVPYTHIKEGDHLWVREAYMVEDYHVYFPDGGGVLHIRYRADGATRDVGSMEDVRDVFSRQQRSGAGNWKPSTQMRSWASRIWLEVTGVRRKGDASVVQFQRLV